MCAIRESCCQSLLEKLKNLLLAYSKEGKPVDYEIYVDSCKAVFRTSDLRLFDIHSILVYDNTKEVEIRGRNNSV